MSGRLFPLLLVSLVLGQGAAKAQDVPAWPGWGGPGGDFRIPEARLASSWPENGPEVLWKRELGEGYSAVIGGERRIFSMFRQGEDEVVCALDASTGDTVWEYRYRCLADPGQTPAYGQGPNAPPLWFEGRLYCIGFTGLLHCLDARSGEKLWSRDLVQDWSGRVQYYGYANTVTAYQGTLLVLVGGSECGVVGLKPETGEVLWKSAPTEISYAQPALITVSGQDQFAFFSPTEVIGMDPRDGSMLWSHPVANLCKTNCTSVVAGEDDLLWVATKGVGGARALRLGRQGPRTKVESVWRDRRLRVYQWNAIRVGDVVYTSSGEGRSAYSAIDIHSGKTLASLPGFHAANSIYADGKLIVLDDGGRLSLLQHTTRGFELLASVALLDSVTWTVPTLVGSTLFVRDRTSVQALDLSPAVVSSVGDEDYAPEAVRILERADAVTGGPAARKIRNRRVEGRVIFPGMDLEAQTLEITARPNRRYFRTDSDLLGTVQLGCDGSQVWNLSEGCGARSESGDALQAALLELAFDGALAWREQHKAARCDGEAMIEGSRCDRVILTPRIGEPETRYYSRDTGLLVRREMVRLSATQGNAPMTLTYSDHRPVDGVWIPHRTHLLMRSCGTEHERLFLTTRVQHDVEVPDSRFAVPEATRES